MALQVEFDTTLDMAPYMSDRRSGPKVFQLYGVLVHQGHSVHSGHYFCYVRAANGLWHQMNDNYVSQVSSNSQCNSMRGSQAIHDMLSPVLSDALMCC